MPYIVSKGGTFGVLERRYTTMSGEAAVVIKWGSGTFTPVLEEDTKVLRSCYEEDAREEAEVWLSQFDDQDHISKEERERISKLFEVAKNLPDDPESDNYEPDPVL